MNDMTNQTKHSKKATKLHNYMKFLVPSIIGILLFVFPVTKDGDVTIPIAILSNFVQTICAPYIGTILFLLITISFWGAILYKLLNRSACKSDFVGKVMQSSLIKSLFSVSSLWIVIRGISFAFALQIYLQNGLEGIVSEATGTFVYVDLLPVLFAVFFLAGLFLPLLLNFGLLEFTGTLLKKVMKPVFGLPGRSAIDAIASWLGDGTIGVLLTSKQYEEGFYTEKEAAVIGTNFSLVSITFSIVVINTVGLPNMFVPFYLTVTIACIIAAIILPKIPPLSRKKDSLIDGKKPEEEFIAKDMTGFRHGMKQALEKAEGQNVIQSVLKDGFANVLDMWIGVIPIVLTIGTIALMLAEFTPVFRILGLPFLPILQLLQIPDAVAASQTLFAGFADMLLPSVMIADVGSELTRFVVAAVSVSQLIYLSEVGALLIASKIPVKMKELVIIFIERTLITLPIIALIGHIIY